MDAPNSTSQSQDPQIAIPKDNTPPPAYTPRRVPDFSSLAARMFQARQNTLTNISGSIQRPPHPQAACTSMLSGDVSDDQDETSEGSSPICLRIDTSINVSRSNNIVCLVATPAEQANAIAKAVVQALHEGSSGQCGIPMIDESGCPRPLKIEVDAGLVVEGTGNIIGSRDVIGELVSRRAESSLRRPHDENENEEDFTPAKRRRSSR
ncbi:Ff.00g093010.m01.CDS01 [Fusarium sp. VM40]|nr:Ff.00g093010.m01.CDS01 [Fusarium sp. VM40]